MKELSVFVDESGDFGTYANHAPYYLVTLVFHDQSINIAQPIRILNAKIRESGLPDCPIHAGPLIRREHEYWSLSLWERKRIFNFLYNFARSIDITYRTLIVEKKQLSDEMDLTLRITKQLSAFLFTHLETFSQYDRVVIYYDFGQMELTKILVSVFNTVLNNVEVRKVIPANYKLFQAADMLCTLELLSLKADKHLISKSEYAFFKTERDLRKSYLNAIQKKKLNI